jgi:hypothetical protein
MQRGPGVALRLRSVAAASTRSLIDRCARAGLFWSLHDTFLA